MPKLSSQKLAAIGSLLCSAAANAAIFNDFEGGTVGQRSGFHDPYFSGTTNANVLQTPEIPNTARVVQGFGSNPSKLLQVNYTWTNPSAAGRWVRMTTFYDGFIEYGQPRNPLVPIDFDGTQYAVEFDMFATTDLSVAIGIRERATLNGTETVGGNGGFAGTIEFVGAERATASATTSPGGKLAAAGQWTTMRYNLVGGDSVLAFTGDGNLTSAWGVFEQLAISAPVGDTTAEVTFYVDNFRVVAVPEPMMLALAPAAMVLRRRGR